MLQAWLQISAKGLREKHKKKGAKQANASDSSDSHEFSVQSIKGKPFDVKSSLLSSLLSCFGVKLLFTISLYLHSLLTRIYSDNIQGLDLNPGRK